MARTELLKYEASTMASSWTEVLCLDQLDDGRWSLGIYSPEWLGSIYELIPEDRLYDDDGEVVVPETWEGHRIIGLGDGEYLETDQLVERGPSVEFSAAEIGVAEAFAKENGWTEIRGFRTAWRSLLRVVNTGG